jgi:hypothetical protein
VPKPPRSWKLQPNSNRFRVRMHSQSNRQFFNLKPQNKLLWALVTRKMVDFPMIYADDHANDLYSNQVTQLMRNIMNTSASLDLLQSSVSIFTTQFETENKVNNNIETILTT